MLDNPDLHYRNSSKQNNRRQPSFGFNNNDNPHETIAQDSSQNVSENTKTNYNQ